MPSVVLDASALLALFFDEPGADIVRSRAEHAVISAVNIEEVVARMLSRGDRLEDIAADIESLTIECIPFDADQAYVAASLTNSCQGRNISQAGRACLALALSRHLPLLTGNREWKDLDVGVTLELIR